MIFPVLFLSFILRIISLNQSLWLDEATSAIVTKMSWMDMFVKFLPNDFHPPLYYILLKLWSFLFGYSEISLRLPSVVFGVATVYLVYLIGKRIANKNIGILASLFLATSGLHVYYSQEARMYSLATFLVSSCVYFFLTKKWFLFSLFLMLVGMTDYVSLFIFPAFLIARFKDWKKMLLSLIPLLTTFIFWLPIFIKQLAGGLSVEGSNWWNILGPLTFKNVVLIPVKFILGRISLDNKILYLLIAVIVCLFFGYILYKATYKKSKLLWIWLITPIFLIILISFKIPSLSYFRLLFCLPAFYLLIAQGVNKKILIILVLLINVSSSAMYLLNPKFHREDWRSAAVALDGEKIVFPSSSQKEALIYYGKENQIVSTDNLNAADKEVWLSRYVWEIFDPSDTVRKNLENLGYNKTSENNFNGVVFWKYRKIYAYRN